MQLHHAISVHYRGRKETHHADIVEEAVLDQCVAQARAVTAPPVRIAIAHGAEDPRKVDKRATAREE